MCGIGGILRTDGGPIDPNWLNIIDARIAHRGPDGCGTFTDRVEQTIEGATRITEIAFIHRRLAIIDLDDGHQPMLSPPSSPDLQPSAQSPPSPEGGIAPTDPDLIALIFNGCIYNHRELRTELQSLGHVFATHHSDTEVLIHGYRQWGKDLEDHLEGMYAFALWDRANARLVLSRDTFGEKPLFVRWSVAGNDKIVAFASDARALAQLDDLTHNSQPQSPASPDAGMPPNTTYLERYLQLGYNWDEHTVYQSSTPANACVFTSLPTSTAEPEKILPDRPRIETSQAEFEKLLDAAVAQRLEADVPLGCFLSGGVDSSLLAALAIRHKPDLQTFTIRMPDDRYDESQHAESVADHLGAQHATLDVAINPAEDLVHLIATLGQPFGDSSILPTYWVSRAARQHVRVALSGDGADELFLGYERYMAARALIRHRRALKWIPRSWFGKWHPKSRKHKLGRLGEMARDSYVNGIIAMESIFSQRQIADLLGRPALDPVWVAPDFDPMLTLRNTDLQHYLPGDLLTKVDTASMAVALEVRAPYLDSNVVRAAVNCPTYMLAPNNSRKHILRSIAAKYLPQHIIDRPKMGFAIPIGEWFRNDFGNMRTLLLDHLSVPHPFGQFTLQRSAIDTLLAQHDSGDYDHSQRLFTLLTLAIWAQLA